MVLTYCEKTSNNTHIMFGLKPRGVWHRNPSINAVASYPARPTIIEKMKLMSKNGIYTKITRHGIYAVYKRATPSRALAQTFFK